MRRLHMTKLGLVRRRRATRATFVQILNEPPSEMFNPPLGLYWPLLRSSSYPAPMTLESRTDFSSNQSRKLFFCPGCARDRLRVSPNPTSRVTTHGGPPPNPPPRTGPISPDRVAVSPPRARPPPAPTRATPARRVRVPSIASTRPRARVRAHVPPIARSPIARGEPAPPKPPPSSSASSPSRAHLARSFLSPHALRARVRGVHDDPGGAHGEHAFDRVVVQCGAHARWRGRRRAGTCVHSSTQTYVMRIGAVYVLRRDGAHVRSRDHLGWVNHLPWVVKVIQITLFRVVIQKVIQILPNLGLKGDRSGNPRRRIPDGNPRRRIARCVRVERAWKQLHSLKERARARNCTNR